MSKDRNCRWSFADRNNGDQYSGPNSSTQETFAKGIPYNSLIREVIQNSLDARISFDEPVTVKFSFRGQRADEFPNLLDLEAAIEACREFYPTNAQAQSTYNFMLQSIRMIKEDNWLPYLLISDSGTKGMSYVPIEEDINHDNPFLAFVRSLGIHSEQENGTGGSFGFGKAAYFGLSPFATVLVSTRVEDNGEMKDFFEGSAWLSTHEFKKSDGTTQLKSNVGYYDNNDGLPVQDFNAIPEPFRRDNSEGTGTNFYILGVKDDSREAYELMKRAVLENFWYAIYTNELTVELGPKIKINSQTLKSDFEQMQNDGSNSKLLSPPYFNVKRLGDINDGKFFRKTINLDDVKELSGISDTALGQLHILIKKDESGNNRFLRMRRLKMLIDTKGGYTNDGFYGILYVSEGGADKILRTTEPPAHDNWSYTRLRAWSEDRKNAKRLLDTLDSIAQQSISEFFNHASKKKTTVKDINKYCAIRDEKEKREDSSEGNNYGGSITTEAANDRKKHPSDLIGGEVLETITVNSEPEKGKTTYRGGSGSGDKDKEGKGGRKRPGDTGKGYKESEKGKKRRLYKPLSIRKTHCLAEEVDNVIRHVVMITSGEDIKNAAVEINVSGSSGKESIPIIEIEPGKGKIAGAESNIVEGLNLRKGLNQFWIRFSEPNKYALKLSNRTQPDEQKK